MTVSLSLEWSPFSAHSESRFMISACEYDAPTTILESPGFEGAIFALELRLRQNGELFLLINGQFLVIAGGRSANVYSDESAIQVSWLATLRSSSGNC